VAVTVLYFAVVRERLKRDRETVAWEPGMTVAGLMAALARVHPELGRLGSVLKVAVNQELVGGDHRLADGDEVALIPPVSGGSGRFRLSHTPLDLDEVIAAVTTPSHGGVATFTGVVRSESRGRRIVRLEYEAYQPMAERKLAEIGGEIEKEHPGARLAVVHRLGRLEVGEAAVVIAASAPHRAAAFADCQAAIDRIKQSVPIWKKEVADDGEEWIGLGP